jgi:hypothetical protein
MGRPYRLKICGLPDAIARMAQTAVLAALPKPTGRLRLPRTG